MQALPIHHVLSEVKEKLQNQTRLVLQAPPGAGKTTALPLALLDEPWLKDKKIIMLEPRRLAVRSSAARMAEMLGEKVGERIGYQVKMDLRYPDAVPGADGWPMIAFVHGFASSKDNGMGSITRSDFRDDLLGFQIDYCNSMVPFICDIH